ncbi:MAG: DUF3370 domain-containing protein [Candidatus Obscuribacterales bacterium]|nr:DUF3370 domain-containing protein [Candidatus Obscuribacterales bacterium]
MITIDSVRHMHPLLVSLIMADSSAANVPTKFTCANNIVRDLPGSLDQTPVLYSNSPELVLTPGILVSTFPATGKRMKSAHLNKLINGRFDVFAHHVAQKNPSGSTLYQSVLLRNPGKRPVTVTIKQAVSCLTSPDAPFISLPAMCDNVGGRVFAGPGDRMADVILRGLSQGGWPAKIVIPAGRAALLYNLPIPVVGGRSRNTRSTLVRASTSAPIYAASLATFTNGQAPSVKDWEHILTNGSLAGPRDRRPTAPSRSASPIYSRVAGVSKGSVWRGYFTDDPHGALRLTIPSAGQSVSYVVATVEQGAFGTKQLQSAPLIVRYPDTSFKAHGNYAVEYNLYIPLTNPTSVKQPVTITLQTPFKSNISKNGLYFTNPPQKQIWFRGTIRTRYRDDNGAQVTRYTHVVERQGDAGSPILSLNITPGETRMVTVDFIYPPDCTPPQILTVSNPGSIKSGANYGEPENSSEETPAE